MSDAQTINSHVLLPHMNFSKPGVSGRCSDAVQVSDVVDTYRAALQRLIGRRSYANFELLLLRSVADAVVSIRRHGIGQDSCVALAARYALDSIEQRVGATSERIAQPEEGETIDALLRAHDHQLRSAQVAPLLVQTIAGEGRRRRTCGHRNAIAMRRQRVNAREGAHG